MGLTSPPWEGDGVSQEQGQEAGGWDPALSPQGCRPVGLRPQRKVHLGFGVTYLRTGAQGRKQPFASFTRPYLRGTRRVF